MLLSVGNACLWAMHVEARNPASAPGSAESCQEEDVPANLHVKHNTTGQPISQLLCQHPHSCSPASQHLTHPAEHKQACRFLVGPRHRRCALHLHANMAQLPDWLWAQHNGITDMDIQSSDTGRPTAGHTVSSVRCIPAHMPHCICCPRPKGTACAIAQGCKVDRRALGD